MMRWPWPGTPPLTRAPHPNPPDHMAALTNAYSRGFSGGSVVKNPPANAGDTQDTGLIPGLARSLGKGNGNSLQCSFLLKIPRTEEPTVHGVAKSQTQLRD